MTAIAWVLLVLLVVAAGAAVALLVARARGVAELQAARAQQQADAARLAEFESSARRSVELLSSAQAEAARLGERIAQSEARHEEALSALAAQYEERLSAERRTSAEYRERVAAEIVEMRRQFEAVIKSHAGEALKQSAEHLLRLTESKLKDDAERQTRERELSRKAVEALVGPIAESLKKTGGAIEQLQQDRAASSARISEQVQQVAAGAEQLRRETANLTQALRKPHVRGRWGELQLRRVVELAGMRDWCDFSEQENTTGPDGDPLRPDLIVRLPNERTIVVDAKTNIEAYLEALEAPTEPDRAAHLDRFARHVSDQASALGKKGYWSRFEGSPDFVVMFIPGDQFIDGALSRRPDLLDHAAAQRVILASPSTLIGLLRAVYVGWREQRVAERAEELIRLGRELHERVAVVLGHATKLGESLAGAVDKYNDFQASLDRRIMPTLRRFEELEARSARELPEPPMIETRPRLGAPSEG